MADNKRKSRPSRAGVGGRWREADQVGAAEDMLDELDHILTEVSGTEPSQRGERKNRSDRNKGKQRRRKTAKNGADDLESMLLDLDIEVEPVKPSKELEKALLVKKDLQKILKEKGSNKVLQQMGKEQKRSLQKMLLDVVPDTVTGSSEAANVVQGVELQLQRERAERLQLKFEDLKISRDNKRQERAALYDVTVAQEKQQQLTMKKKIYSFMAQLAEQAAKGQFEQEQLDQPIEIAEPTRPSKELVMRKKEAKIEGLHATTTDVDHEAYDRKVNAYSDAKELDQKQKEHLKREKLQDLTGIKMVDPEKIVELERMIKAIPIVNPDKVSALEKKLQGVPIIDPKRLAAVESMIKKVDSDAKVRHDMLSQSVKTDQSARQRQQDRDSELKQQQATKAMADRVALLQAQLESVKSQQQEHVKTQTVKNLQFETQANQAQSQSQSDNDKKVGQEQLMPIMNKVAQMEGTIAEIKNELNSKTMQLEQDGKSTGVKAETLESQLKQLEDMEPTDDGFKPNLVVKIEWLEQTMTELRSEIGQDQVNKNLQLERQSQLLEKQGQVIASLEERMEQQDEELKAQIQAQAMTVDFLLESITSLTKQMQEMANNNQMAESQEPRFEQPFDVRSAPFSASRRQNFGAYSQDNQSQDSIAQAREVPAQIDLDLSNVHSGTAMNRQEVLTTNEALERFQQENQRMLNAYVAQLESGRHSENNPMSAAAPRELDFNRGDDDMDANIDIGSENDEQYSHVSPRSNYMQDFLSAGFAPSCPLATKLHSQQFKLMSEDPNYKTQRASKNHHAANYTYSVGSESRRYNRSGSGEGERADAEEEYNVGFDSQSQQSDFGDVDPDLYDPDALHDNPLLARADSLSVQSIESKDSEVTAPPTPRSTDSEEEHQTRQQLLQSQQLSARLQQPFSHLSRGTSDGKYMQYQLKDGYVTMRLAEIPQNRKLNIGKKKSKRRRRDSSIPDHRSNLSSHRGSSSQGSLGAKAGLYRTMQNSISEQPCLLPNQVQARRSKRPSKQLYRTSTKVKPRKTLMVKLNSQLLPGSSQSRISARQLSEQPQCESQGVEPVVNTHAQAIMIENREADAGSSPDNPPLIPNIAAPKIKTLKIKKQNKLHNIYTGTEEEAHFDGLQRTSNNAYSYGGTTEQASQNSGSAANASKALQSQHKQQIAVNLTTQNLSSKQDLSDSPFYKSMPPQKHQNLLSLKNTYRKTTLVSEEKQNSLASVLRNDVIGAQLGRLSTPFASSKDPGRKFIPTLVPQSIENRRYAPDTSTPLDLQGRISCSKLVETDLSNSDCLVIHRRSGERTRELEQNKSKADDLSCDPTKFESSGRAQQEEQQEDDSEILTHPGQMASSRVSLPEDHANKRFLQP